MRLPKLAAKLDLPRSVRYKRPKPPTAAEEHARQIKDLEAQLVAFERTHKIARAREHLLDFTEFTMPDPEAPNDVSRSRYKAAKFHKIIASDIDRFIAGDLRNDDGSVCTQLIFCMPPRHGKTALATKSLAAWYMGRNPSHQVAVATYSDAVANDFGSDTRAIVLSQPYKQVFPAMKLRRGGTAKDNMETVLGGRTVFVGRGGALTGKGAHCFPAGTKVATTAGSIPIESLALAPLSVKVLSYDHSTKRIVAKSAEAFANRTATRLLRVSTTGGRMVVATADHPFFTVAGYKEASELAAGDRLVCLVQERNGTSRIRHDENDGGRSEVLFADVLGEEPERRETRASRMRHMRGVCAEGVEIRVEQEHILLERMPGNPSCSEARGDCGEGSGVQVRGMRRVISALCGEGENAEILRKGLQGPSAFPPDVRREQSRFSSRAEPEEAEARDRSVPGSEGADRSARRRRVSAVRVDDEAARTSSVAGPAGQQTAEPRVAVQRVPSPASREREVERRWEEDRVLSVDEVPVGEGGVEVYDIQVEGTHCFFADGVLVHNCLLIDDLYKDHEEARSPAIRDQTWNWFTKVAMTRRMGKKLVMITMTRWHSDDIIGRLTDKTNPYWNEAEAKRWKIIRLPAIAEDDDPLFRAPGEALWPDGPDTFDLDFLMSQQRLDPLGFAALYQQRPTVADGILFRRETIQRYDRKDLPEDLRYYAASDHAVGTSQRNDPSCFIKVGVDRHDNVYVIDCIWKRMPTDAAVEAMLTMASGDTRPIVWWAERGHISKSIGPFLMKRAAETGIYLNVREVTPANDKSQRAQSIAARVAMGKVFFPKEEWADRAIEEMLAFPNGTHDDFVDALAYIGLGLQNMFGAKTSKSPVQSSPKFGTLAWVRENDRFAEERKRAASRGGF